MSKIADYLLEVQNNPHHQWSRVHRAEMLIIFAIAVFILLLARLAM